MNGAGIFQFLLDVFRELGPPKLGLPHFVQGARTPEKFLLVPVEKFPLPISQVGGRLDDKPALPQFGIRRGNQKIGRRAQSNGFCRIDRKNAAPQGPLPYGDIVGNASQRPEFREQILPVHSYSARSGVAVLENAIMITPVDRIEPKRFSDIANF
jgi:hypothetical protein